MKKCFKCGEVKRLIDFYKHPDMPDGHVNKCKECNKSDVKANYMAKVSDPVWMETERKRGRVKYRNLYRYTGSANPIANARWKEKYPEKNRAKNASQKLPAPSPGLHKHHWSYNDEHFKDVIWLTIEEHGKAHRFISYDQKSKMYTTKDGTNLLDTKEKHEFYIKYCIKFYED